MAHFYSGEYDDRSDKSLFDARIIIAISAGERAETSFLYKAVNNVIIQVQSPCLFQK